MRKLVKQITCPNCWEKFKPENIKAISKHSDLLGDEIVGENEYRRFLPIEFSVQGNPIDAKGVETDEYACPACNLEIHDSFLESSSLFVSLIGAPASGKSYYLATLIWGLRNLMPKLGFLFTDADPEANGVVCDYEKTLFLNPKKDELTEIPKTQTDDPRLYRMIKQKGVTVRMTRPMKFLMKMTQNHRNYDETSKGSRILVMYDNAGEDYLPKKGEFGSSVIEHLAKAHVLFMLFDPTQDTRFKIKSDVEVQSINTVRQETILGEVASKIRRSLGISPSVKIKTPLVIIVPKFDLLEIPEISLEAEPLITSKNGVLAVDGKRINRYSQILRDYFMERSPEMVALADEITDHVVYIPVSSLGTQAECVKSDGHKLFGIRPQNIKPHWVTAPLLYAFSHWASGMIPRN